MSTNYDEYLIDHIGGVKKAFAWMCENLPHVTEKMEDHRYIIEQHDNSKYTSEEYDAYDRYFYGGNRSAKVVSDFNYAWLHHIHNNPHHWQYWVLQHDDEPEEVLLMPYWYIIEMICDWWSFSWKSGNLYEIFDWYEKHKEMKLHPATRTVVESILNQIKKKLDENKEDFDIISDEILEHHGIKGQKWGTKNGPPYPIKSAFKSTSDLSDHMKSFKYKEYDKLMNPDDVENSKSGSCHDQVMFECRELRKLGKNPKCLFVIENDGSQGGMTHSLVYYPNDDGTVTWFENAWSERAGETKYNNVEKIKKEISNAHKSGEFGDISNYKDLEFSEFSDSDHEIGEDLQKFVDRCFKNSEENKEKSNG